jgi:glutathione S-transferase
MADVTLYGLQLSTFTRTARMACVEKDVTYDLVEVELGSPAHLAVQPFGKVPALRHGDFMLYETAAIARYIDMAFPGGRLSPAEPKAAARAIQWASVTADCAYQVMIRELVWQRVVMPMMGGQADEAAIAGAVPKLERQLAIYDKALGENAWLAGDALSIADLMFAPILFYVAATPEGQAALKDRRSVNRWFGAIAERPSFKSTMPVMPK